MLRYSENLSGGRYVAAAIGHGITIEADTLDELRSRVKDAVEFPLSRFRKSSQNTPALFSVTKVAID